MRAVMVLLSVCLVAQGCQSQSNKTTQSASAVPAIQQEVSVANEERGAASPPVAPKGKLSGVEGARLKGLAWVGDASAAVVRPFMGRYAQSGYWADAEGGRRTLLVGDGRYAGPKDEIGYVIVDATPEGARLKLFRGQTFTPADVAMEMPVSGVVEKMATAAAHDRIAVLGWDGAKPQLTVYNQRDKKQVWSVPLDIEPPGATPLVLTWYDTGELAVERRGADSYERVIVDGETGAVLLRDELDPKIVAVIQDPVKFILEQPWTAPTDKVDESKLTTAQRFMRNPGNALGAVCMMAQRETRSIRIVELEDGILLIAEGTHGDGGDGYAQRDRTRNMRFPGIGEDAAPDEPPRHPLSDGASCSAVTLMDSKTIQFKGRWSTGRADGGAHAAPR